MVEEKCVRCDRGKEQVKLLDAISSGEIVKLCEECALSEDVPVIRKPTTSQLKESERLYNVHERLRRMAGLPAEKWEVNKITKKTGDITLDDLRKRKQEKDRLELAKERNVPLNLIDNFNWYVIMARKKKKLTRKELAELLAESETAIKMIENKEMPEDASKLIAKLEQFFGLKLKKEKEVEREEEAEERIKAAIKERFDKVKAEEKKPVLKFDRETTKNITIADLQRMRDKRSRYEGEMKKVEDVVWSRDKGEGKGKIIENVEEKKKELVDSEIEFDD